MPVFEHDDELSDEEFRRQQEQLDAKIRRLKGAKKSTQELEWEKLQRGEFNLHLEDD